MSCTSAPTRPVGCSSSYGAPHPRPLECGRVFSIGHPAIFSSWGTGLRHAAPGRCVVGRGKVKARRRCLATRSTFSEAGRYGREPGVKVGDSFVHSPVLSRSRKPKGLIHFLGGAFIGRAPELTYRLFIELLAKEGYLIVATPYSITFDHSACALELHRKFNDSLDILLDSGFAPAGLSAEDVANLPIYSVGHSNGALMQVLIGCVCKDRRLPKANAIVSFNNKSASEAVPYFDQIGPRIVQMAPLASASPVTSFVQFVADEVVPAVGNFLGPKVVPESDVTSVSNFLSQIPGVLTQVTEGISEFTPTPADNRRNIAASYSIPNTLLVKYTVDTIDESDILEELLQPRIQSLGGKLQKIILTGTHATPLAPDLRWRTGDVYTPIDAIGQVLRNAALADLRGTARSIVDWFDLL